MHFTCKKSVEKTTKNQYNQSIHFSSNFQIFWSIHYNYCYNYWFYHKNRKFLSNPIIKTFNRYLIVVDSDFTDDQTFTVISLFDVDSPIGFNNLSLFYRVSEMFILLVNEWKKPMLSYLNLKVKIPIFGWLYLWLGNFI